ncbi:hypothetical protein D3C86_1943720 [compost metagenome]
MFAGAGGGTGGRAGGQGAGSVGAGGVVGGCGARLKGPIASKLAPTRVLCTQQIHCGSELARDGVLRVDENLNYNHYPERNDPPLCLIDTLRPTLLR